MPYSNLALGIAFHPVLWVKYNPIFLSEFIWFEGILKKLTTIAISIQILLWWHGLIYFFEQIVILSPAVLLILTGKMGGVVASEYGSIGSCCYHGVYGMSSQLLWEIC